MAYNLTAVGNSTGPLAFVQNVNVHLMDGWLGTLLLLSLGMVFLMSYFWSTRDVSTSVGATMYVSFLLSIMLRAMDLVPDLAVFICLIGAGFSVAFLHNRN